MFEAFLQGMTVAQQLFLEGDIFAFLSYLFFHGGWLLVFVLFFLASFQMHRIFKILRYIKQFRWVLLAIDVPKENEQTPRAVENIFAHLAGAHATRDLIEKYWLGEMQRWFSFEIVSIEGYVQFVIATDKKHRDLVEALVYAQYPDVEITEIEDYCQWAPEHYPDPEYKVWGLEFQPADKDYTNPIRTWVDFEDPVSGLIKDPMAALLETFSRMGKGEQLWMQLLIRPIGQKWIWKGIERANKIMGKKIDKQTTTQKALSAPLKALDSITQYAMTGEVPGSSKEEQKLQWGALILSPVDVATIKAIGEKIGRIGFETKLRFVYIAKKELYNKSKAHYGLVGAMKQFTDETSNALKPETRKTQVSAHYFLTEWRKNRKRNKIVKYYKKRDVWSGFPRFILNIRELASVWHFPMLEVKTPTLKFREARTSRPPVGLPFSIQGAFGNASSPFVRFGKEEPAAPTRAAEAPSFEGGARAGGVTAHGGGLDQKRGAPPPNLPFV